MRFRTELHLLPCETKISHNEPILMLGSCFSQSIGEYLTKVKFQTLVNPFGTLYHPASIYNVLMNCLLDKNPNNDRIVSADERILHYDYHSKIVGRNEEELLTNINKVNSVTSGFLMQCKHIFITLGTAYYFHNTALEITVANCHKQPGDLFERKLLSFNETILLLNDIITLIKKHSPKVMIHFTISPVRHLRDGLIANAQSKAILRAAVGEVVQQYKDVFYFPAYELILDDLRDYRFYAADLTHPNQLGIDYVWEKFQEVYFTEATQHISERVIKIKRLLAHRPFAPNSVGWQKLKTQTIKKIENLVIDTGLDFSKEKEHFLSQ